MNKKRSTTKNFHILGQNLIISNYFKEGKVKEILNINFDNKNFHKENWISWGEVLSHNASELNGEWISKFNEIEDETTKIENEWFEKRFKKFISIDDNLYFKTFIIEEIDIKYILNVFEKLYMIPQNYKIDFKNTKKGFCMIPKFISNKDFLSLIYYIKFKRKENSIDEMEEKYYKNFSENYNYFFSKIKKTKSLFIFNVENILTSHPLQIKMLPIGNNNVLVESILFQIHPQKILVCPLSDFSLEKINSLDKEIIFQIFYRSFDEITNIPIPLFLYIDKNNELNYIYKNIIKKNINKPPVILPIKFDNFGQKNEDISRFLICLDFLYKNILLINDNKESEIIFSSKFNFIEELECNMFSSENKLIHNKLKICKFKVNDELIYPFLNLRKLNDGSMHLGWIIFKQEGEKIFGRDKNNKIILELKII